MRVEFRFLASTLACLAAGLTPLGAGPTYHVRYQGQANGPFRTDQEIWVGAYVLDEFRYSIDGPCTVEGCVIATLAQYDDVMPRIHLPAGSRVLSAWLYQDGGYSISETVTTSVEPPGSEPSVQDPPGGDFSLEAVFDGEFGRSCFGDFRLDSGSFNCQSLDYAQQVRDALESGSPVQPLARSVALVAHGGPGRWTWGKYSLTMVKIDFLPTGSAGYDLFVTYEAAIPEPGTAPLFLTGAIGLLLLRRSFRTHQ